MNLNACYFLPAIESRFATRINPHYGPAMDREANAWARAQLGQDDLAQPARRLDNFTIWAALAYTDVDAATLTDWCRFNALYTMIENRVERALDGAREGHALDLWNLLAQTLFRMATADEPEALARAACAHPAALQALLAASRLAAKMPGALGGRFLHAVGRLAQAQRDEYTILVSTRMDFADYADYRVWNYGIPVFIVAAASMLRQQPTAAEWNAPARLWLEQLVARQCFLVNDLYSFPKESAERAERRELVQTMTVLMASEHLHAPAAVERAVAMIRGCEDEFVAVRDRLFAAGASPGLREYCRRLEDMMAGNLRYMLISPRYYGADFTGEFGGAWYGCDGQPLPALRAAA